MSRPLRIELPGALYHLTSRGDRREPIFVDDTDRAIFLAVLEQALVRYDGELWAYCLMGNHYHLVLGTRTATLSRLMRHLNGVYTQSFNRRHGMEGHLFQGRFKAILVDSERYLLSLCRYVELNPVRAHLVADVADWPWSSFRAHAGLADAPAWLEVPRIHELMLGRPLRPGRRDDLARAARAYERAVRQTPHERFWEEALQQQIYLGDEAFVQRMQDLAERGRKQSHEVPAAQRARPLSLAEWLATSSSREAALLAAYRESGLTMTEMAAELGLSVSRVSRLIQRAEMATQATPAPSTRTRARKQGRQQPL